MGRIAFDEIHPLESMSSTKAAFRARLLGKR
jgi:hypothetical protein